MKIGRILGALSVMALTAMLVASVVAPAAAHSGKTFGAVLTKTTQPSNSNPPQTCEFGVVQQCTWVMREAWKTPGARTHQAKAPRNGVIKKIRLIAGTSGSFRLQIAKIKPGTQKAKIIRNGPKISYKGQPEEPDPDSVGTALDEYVIETFKVKVPIKKGQSLAVRAKKLSALRCQSGGPATLVFYDDPLKPGQRFRKRTATEGCYMLIRAIMK